MKFLIVGDLHGSIPKIKFKDFDAIIAPGDFCSDSARKYISIALKEYIKNPKSKKRWYDLVGKSKAKEIIKKSLSDGRAILEKLNSFNVPVYIVPGNWDWTASKDKWDYLRKNHYNNIKKGLSNLKDVHYKLKNINGYEIIGYGISSGPEFPQQELKRFSEKELIKKKKMYERTYNKINKLFLKASKPLIFLSHNVPFNTRIDKITNPSSPRVGQHFGSLITRKMIDKHQPLVCIGGHMHEHFGKVKIGKTIAINSGFGPNVNILMELKENKIKQLVFKKN